MSEETGGNLPAPANPDGQLELWGEMLAVERERIASRNRAVEAMREGFSKLDAVTNASSSSIPTGYSETTSFAIAA